MAESYKNSKRERTHQKDKRWSDHMTLAFETRSLQECAIGKNVQLTRNIICRVLYPAVDGRLVGVVVDARV
jgi:hypothetical protein